jgi:SHS2 domain-containing protein
MNLNDFEIVDHPSDTGIKAWAQSPEKLFEICARAMFSIICNVGNVKPLKAKKIKINEKIILKPDELLIIWLEKLLYLHETGKMLFSSFHVSQLRFKDQESGGQLININACGYSLCSKNEKKASVKKTKAHLGHGSLIIAEVYGEAIDFNKHEIFSSIKAPTYHMLKVEKDPNTGCWNANVIFDV